jgi:hypothetical protein
MSRYHWCLLGKQETPRLLRHRPPLAEPDNLQHKLCVLFAWFASTAGSIPANFAAIFRERRAGLRRGRACTGHVCQASKHVFEICRAFERERAFVVCRR